MRKRIVLSLLLYGGPFVFGLLIMRLDPVAGLTFAVGMVILATVIVRAAEHQRLWGPGL